MKDYKYILFDWDGTIAQTTNLWPVTFDAILRKRGVNLTREQMITACSGLVGYLVKNTKLSKEESEKVLDEGLEVASHKIPTLGLYPGAIEVLNNMKNQDKRLALITSSRRKVMEPLYNKFNLSKIFDVEICVEDAEYAKPHPAPLNKALGILKGNKEEAIAIGDTPSDLIAANEAGIDSIFFYPDEHKEFHKLDKITSKHKPKYVAKDFSEISDIILS